MKNVLVHSNKIVWRSLIAIALCLMTHAVAAQEGLRATKYLVVVDTSPSMFQKPDSPLAINWKKPAMLEVQRQLGEFVANLPDGTEVDLASFDTAYRQGASMVVRSQTERLAARRYFQSLHSVGGLTHLWASMDVALEQASAWLATHPGSTIRILFYTDGTDTEHLSKGGVRRDPQVILAKYSDVLKNHVKFNLVTIGFELQADVLKKLEAGHVTVTKAIATQQNLIPLESAFSLTPSQPMVGDVVQLHDESQGAGIVKRETEWGDGSVDGELSHIYATPSEYVVRHILTTQTNQVAVSTQRLVVAQPPALVARFSLSATSVELGQDIQVLDESQTIADVERSYFLDERAFSNAQHPKLTATKEGEHRVKLVLRDRYGQTSEAEHKFTVIPIELPELQAAFSLLSERVLLGDEVLVVDESIATGEVQRTYRLDGELISNDRNPRWQAATAGTHKLDLELRDQHGQISRMSRKVVVGLPAAPEAQFRLVKSQITVGETVQAIDESTGAEVWDWSTSAGHTAKVRNPSFEFDTAGDFDFLLVVTDRYGQTSQAQAKLVVVQHAAPTVDFSAPDSLMVGEKLDVVNRSSGLIDTQQWNIDGSLVSRERDLLLEKLAVGEHELELVASGPGGQARQTKHFVVTPYPQPVASFTVGSEQPFVGDRVIFTDTSTGKVDRVEWWFGASTDPVTLDYVAGSLERSVSYTCVMFGPLTVRANAYGPSGASECERTIQVATRTKPPKTRIEAETTKGRGELKVRFQNHSEGTIYKTLVDFGDGTGNLELAGRDGASHAYGPGRYVAKFTSVGPEEFGVNSDTIEIVVAKPLPPWVWHSLWAAPLTLGLLVVGGLLARNRRDNQLLHAAAKLSGTFSFKRRSEIGTIFEVVSLDGTADECDLQLGDGNTAALRSLINDDGVSFQVTVSENGSDFSETLIAGEDKVVGSYVVNYVQ